MPRVILCGARRSRRGAAQSALPARAPAGRRARVAILDFDYATVYSNVAAIFGTNVDVGKGVTDLLVTYLVKDGSYSVIERKALDKILAEQNFSNSDRADATSAAKIGKLLGVDAIIVGSITQFGNDTKNTGVGGVGAGLGKLGLGGVSQKESKAIVGLTARVVNVDTGEILAAAEGMGESKRTSTSLTGGGGGWGGFGAGNVDFGNSDFQNTIIGEAVKARGREDEHRRHRRARPRGGAPGRRSRAWSPRLPGTQLVLNVGGKAGVKVGDQLSVERVDAGNQGSGDRQSHSPHLSSSVGIVRVVDVDDDSSVADIVSGSGFKVSDVVKTANK